MRSCVYVCALNSSTTMCEPWHICICMRGEFGFACFHKNDSIVLWKVFSLKILFVLFIYTVISSCGLCTFTMHDIAFCEHMNICFTCLLGYRWKRFSGVYPKVEMLGWTAWGYSTGNSESFPKATARVYIPIIELCMVCKFLLLHFLASTRHFRWIILPILWLESDVSLWY